jgi:hypothetical protein
MADKMRWQYGDTNPVVADVESDTVIEIGDILWQQDKDRYSATAKPASDRALDNRYFSADFLGVAMQRSRKGDDAPIRVATTGTFQFDCEPTKWKLGDYVEVGYDNERFSNQQVLFTDRSRPAIGRVHKRELHESTTVLVSIVSTVMCGGIVGTSY